MASCSIREATASNSNLILAACVLAVASRQSIQDLGMRSRKLWESRLPHPSHSLFEVARDAGMFLMTEKFGTEKCSERVKSP